MTSENTNTSGQGPSSEVPAEVKRWSWGGFCLNWIWGAFNGTYIAFLCFVPLVNFVMPFVLGAKGNEWAWRNKRWDSIERFHEVQKTWAIVGLVILLGSAVIGAGIVATSAFIFMEVQNKIADNPEFKKLVKSAEKNPQVTALIGEDLSLDGGFNGNISINNDGGEIDASFAVKGSKGKGKFYVKGTREAGVWNFTMFKFGKEGSDERVDLLPGLKSDESGQMEGETGASEAIDMPDDEESSGVQEESENESI